MYPVHLGAANNVVLNNLTYLRDHYGASFSLVSKRGMTPLHHAALLHDAEAVSYLIEQEEQQTLVSAPAPGYSATTADDPVDRTGWLPIHCAAADDTTTHRASSFYDTLCALIEHEEPFDCDINAESENGLNAAWIAARYNSTTAHLTVLQQRCANLRFSHYGHGSLLHAAAANGSVEVLSFLIQQGVAHDDAVPGRVTTIAGVTPLHVAAQHGRVAMVKRLLDLGAGVDVPDNFGATPLFSCLQAPPAAALECMEILLSYGANPLHATNAHGGRSVPCKACNTLMHACCQHCAFLHQRGLVTSEPVVTTSTS